MHKYRNAAETACEVDLIFLHWSGKATSRLTPEARMGMSDSDVTVTVTEAAACLWYCRWFAETSGASSGPELPSRSPCHSLCCALPRVTPPDATGRKAHSNQKRQDGVDSSLPNVGCVKFKEILNSQLVLWSSITCLQQLLHCWHRGHQR